MDVRIGYIENGTPVQIANSSPNNHIAIFGISGSGKSTRISKIVENIVESGGTVVAFDLAGQDYQNINSATCRISARSDGFDLKLLDTSMVEQGIESYINYISFVVDLFTDVYRLGVRQQAALRMAIEYASKNIKKFPSEMAAIQEGLNRQETAVADGVASKLWQILNAGVFRHNEKKFRRGQINILDFGGINNSAQHELAEIVLACIWRKIRLTGAKEKICIVIDEFQNFVRSKRSALLEMLREARKYNVNIILATQTPGSIPKDVMSSISQTAVQLYFRPSICDRRAMASLISESRVSYWSGKLDDLHIGESIAVGNLAVNGRDINGPLIVRTRKNKEKSFMLSV